MFFCWLFPVCKWKVKLVRRLLSELPVQELVAAEEQTRGIKVVRDDLSASLKGYGTVRPRSVGF